MTGRRSAEVDEDDAEKGREKGWAGCLGSLVW